MWPHPIVFPLPFKGACYNANHLISMVGWGTQSPEAQEFSLHLFSRNSGEHQNAPRKAA